MRVRLVKEEITQSKHHVMILGPRQVGKSTLCQSLDPIKIINLMDERLFLDYAKDPGLLKRELAPLADRHGTIVIDEIQRLPMLLNTLQTIIDDPKCKWRFIVTGSSARKLRRGTANLLPGRLITQSMTPLLWSEVGKDFELDRGLRLGMLPGILLKEDTERVLESYTDIYLREEIQAEAIVQDIGSYARFLDVFALTSGQWLNYSKLASDSEIPKETIRRYVQVLEDTLLAYRVPPFESKTKRRVSQKERIFLFDIGVRNALLGLHRSKLPLTEVGSAFEQWVILQILYLNATAGKRWRISSYRSEGGAEVDLVIETPKEFIALEIKASKNIGPTDLRGLKSISEIAPQKKTQKYCVAYLGDRRQTFDTGIAVWPIIDFLNWLSDL